MDLSKYQELTGITVSNSMSAFIAAQLNRSQAMLETMLGYPLSPDSETNLYNELGKSKRECACPSVSSTETLDEPDAIVGSYRLFHYNSLDQYFHVDPFTKIHKVKLVYVKQGDEPNGITVRTFSDNLIRVHKDREGWGKYIEHCKDCLCVCKCTDCVQLAIDADWLFEDTNDMPLDLQYLLADMVTHYADPKRNIKSENITTHSYTKFSNQPPEMEPHNLSVLKKYAGPRGSVTVMPTW